MVFSERKSEKNKFGEIRTIAQERVVFYGNASQQIWSAENISILSGRLVEVSLKYVYHFPSAQWRLRSGDVPESQLKECEL